MITDENLEKLRFLWSNDHKCEWIETFLKIPDKTGKMVPFKLTSEQRYLVENLSGKNIINKSRQLGISAVVLALSIRACVVDSNVKCLLVSHSLESTNKIFSKLKTIFFSLPDWLRPELHLNSRQELSFFNGSSISCVTCGNKDLARGATLNGIVHLSEYAFWKRQKGQLNSIMQALSSSGTLIIESTSNGFNDFSELYMKARNGENDFKPFFFGWLDGMELFRDEYALAVRDFKKRNGKLLTPDDYDEEEKQLQSLGMTIEQAIWRRSIVSIHGADHFRREYPASPSEGFITTSASVFDLKKVDSLIGTIRTGKRKDIPKSEIENLPPVLAQYMPLKLKIWQKPMKIMKYFIGCDVAEGKGQDYSTCVVLSGCGEEVCEFRSNTIEPYRFAELVNALGRYYNKALLVVEKASGGHAVISRLRYDYKYLNMLKYKSYDQFNRVVWQVGFETNKKSKSIAVNDCIELFDRGLILINSVDLLDEMKTFQVDDNGSFNAVRGCHDDLVAGLWLAVQGFKSPFYYPF